MSWYEVSLNCKAAEVEPVIAYMEDIGALAVSIYDAEDQPLLEPLPGETPLWDEAKIVGLYPISSTIEILQNKLASKFTNNKIEVNILQDQAWERCWMEHFKPMQFADKLWVIPSNLTDFEQSGIKLILDPGLAFGTGTHPTTSLCLTYLAENPPQHKTVLDFGCGSGILGIAALKLGAKFLYGIDHDSQAITSSIDNLQRNQITKQQFQICLPKDLPPNTKVDLIVANILAKPLVELAPTMEQYCADNGKIILSGLLQNQVEEVIAAYKPWFDFKPAVFEDEWVLLEGVKINHSTKRDN